MEPRNTTLVVHIDELVAHGLDRHTAVRLGAALRTELARLLADGEVPARLRAGADIAALTLPDLPVRHGADAASSGRGLARALHQELGHTGPSGGTGARRP